MKLKYRNFISDKYLQAGEHYLQQVYLFLLFQKDKNYSKKYKK